MKRKIKIGVFICFAALFVSCSLDSIIDSFISAVTTEMKVITPPTWIQGTWANTVDEISIDFSSDNMIFTDASTDPDTVFNAKTYVNADSTRYVLDVNTTDSYTLNIMKVTASGTLTGAESIVIYEFANYSSGSPATVEITRTKSGEAVEGPSILTK